MIFIFYGVMIFFALCVYITGRSAAKINHHILLSVTLPAGVETSDEVRQIVTVYSKRNFWLLWAALAAAFPLFLVRAYPSFSLLYLFCWIAAVLYGYHFIFKNAYRQLYRLKKERGWLVGRQHILTVDTEVSRLKHTMPLSRWWFLPPGLFAAVPVGLSLWREGGFRWAEMLLSGSALVAVGILFWLRNAFAAQRAVVYSKDTKVNQACCYVYQRAWSVCLTVSAWMTSLLMGGNSLSFLLDVKLFSGWELVSVAINLLVLPVLIVLTYENIRKRQNRLLSVAREPIYVDEDAYWNAGVYDNPNDSRVFVEKRVGYGLTCNMANSKSRAFVYGLLVLVMMVVLSIFVLLLRMDTSGLSLSIKGDIVTIQAPLYGTSFSIEEIQETELLQSLPKGRRVDGMATDRYLLGRFRLDGYGDGLVYVYTDEPPYVLLHLTDRVILLNRSMVEKEGQALLADYSKEK